MFLELVNLLGKELTAVGDVPVNRFHQGEQGGDKYFGGSWRLGGGEAGQKITHLFGQGSGRGAILKEEPHKVNFGGNVWNSGKFGFMGEGQGLDIQSGGPEKTFLDGHSNHPVEVSRADQQVLMGTQGPVAGILEGIAGLSQLGVIGKKGGEDIFANPERALVDSLGGEGIDMLYGGVNGLAGGVVRC